MRPIYTLIILIGASFCSYSQSAFTSASKGYYTIVGAFAIKENAVKYNASLQKSGIHSACGYLTSRNIYYVYTTKSDDAAVCLREMEELRKKPEFWDAWVRYIGEDGATASVETRIIEEPAPVTEVAAVQEQSAVHGPPMSEAAIEEDVPDQPPVSIPINPSLKSTEIFLSLYNVQRNV